MVPGVPWCSGETAELAQQSFQPLAENIRSPVGGFGQPLPGRSFELELNEQIQVLRGQVGPFLAQAKEVSKRRIALEGFFRRLSGRELFADLLGRELGRGAEFAIRPFEGASSQSSSHSEGKVGMTRPPGLGAERLEERGQGMLRDVFAGKEGIAAGDLTHGRMHGGDKD